MELGKRMDWGRQADDIVNVRAAITPLMSPKVGDERYMELRKEAL